MPVETAVLAIGIAATAFALRNLAVAIALFTALTFFEGAPESAAGRSSVPQRRRWSSPGSSSSRRVGRARSCCTNIRVRLVRDRARGLDGRIRPVGDRQQRRALRRLPGRAAARPALPRLHGGATGERPAACRPGFVAGAALTTIVPLLGFGAANAADAHRFGGYLGNPNNLAAVLLPALALAGFMAIGSRSPPSDGCSPCAASWSRSASSARSRAAASSGCSRWPSPQRRWPAPSAGRPSRCCS